MKRWVALLLCLLLTGTLAAGMAEGIAPGRYAQEMQAQALEAGLEVTEETTYAWGGLPLLDADLDSAIGSLLKELKTQRRTQGTEGDGYTALDLFLKNVSVLDLSMQVADGVYYEQSNLIGGQTVAFTPDEFSTFVSRLSVASGSALPPNLDMLFQVVTRALGGASAIQIDMETIDGALQAYADWQQSALTETVRLRPQVRIPGLYGVRETVVEITRDEFISLAKAYSDLLADNEMLWQDAAAELLPEANEEELAERARFIADTMRSLPDLLQDALPLDLKPAEYREVFGYDDQLVVRQLDIYLPEGARLYVEWVPDVEGIPPMVATLQMGNSTLGLILTRTEGMPVVDDRITRQENSLVAEVSYEEENLRLDMVITRSEAIEQQADRETVKTKTEWMMESEALLGKGAVVSLLCEETDTATGTPDKNYTRRTEAIWRLKGLGFDTTKILTVSGKTTLAAAQPPAAPDTGAVRPALLDDVAFAAWIAGTQVSATQVVYTILGRLPSDVAAYVLQLMRGTDQP